MDKSNKTWSAEWLFEHSPDLFVMTDTQGTILSTNAAWRNVTGWSNRNLIGRPLIDVVHPKSRVAFGRALEGSKIDSGVNLRLEVASSSDAAILVDGNFRRSSGMVAAALRLVGGADEDHSTLLNAYEKLESAERRLEIALKAADAAIYDIEYGARSLWLSPNLSEVIGRSLTFDDVDMPVWECVHPEDVRIIAEAAAEMEATGRIVPTDIRIIDEQGCPRWVRAYWRVDLNPDGSRKRTVGLLLNFEERKQLELSFIEAERQAQAATQSKSDFLANMSHEIRTPLNGVLGIVGALGRTELTPTQVEMVEIIEGSAKTLQTLLSDVLDLSRIESGRLEIAPEPFDVKVLVSQVCALFKDAAAHKGLTIDLVLDAKAGGLRLGDPVRIRQILSNLISNAVKFTENGGITVKVSSRRQAMMMIEVVDTGIGFDEDFRQRLFGRFNQADASITRRFGGTGLGLAISKALADMMGGALDAEAEPGRGATFRLMLPLKRTSALKIAGPPRAKPHTSKNATVIEPLILLAEDHPTNRRVVELILQETPVRLVAVENGSEAVLRADAESFDLILMDMQMPVMDGLAATREIRRREATLGRRRTPICMLTANALPQHIQESMAAGADRHLAKPLSASALLNMVEELLG